MTDDEKAVVREYIKARIKITPGGCWEWALSTGSHGYPQGSLPKITGQRVSLAHRLSYKGFVGEIAPKMQIDHLCKNKKCVNPDHLEQVSQQTNIRRQTNTSENLNTCAHGHINLMSKDKRGMKFCKKCKTNMQRKYREKKKLKLANPA